MWRAFSILSSLSAINIISFLTSPYIIYNEVSNQWLPQLWSTWSSVVKHRQEKMLPRENSRLPFFFDSAIDWSWSWQVMNIFFSKVHLEVAKETSLLLCTCRLAYLLCLQPKEIGRGKTNKSWLLFQDLSIQSKCSNLVFGLCGKISGRLRNLSGSPRDVVHVEEGIDDEEQVPLTWNMSFEEEKKTIQLTLMGWCRDRWGA